MLTDRIFGIINAPYKSTAVIAPSGAGKTTAARAFAVLACKHRRRVLFLQREKGEVDASIRYFHDEVSGAAKTSHVIYDLKSGGNIRCERMENYFNLPVDYVPDILVVDLDYVQFTDSMDIYEMRFGIKLIVVTARSDEYLGCIVRDYHYLSKTELAKPCSRRSQ